MGRLQAHGGDGTCGTDHRPNGRRTEKVRQSFFPSLSLSLSLSFIFFSLFLPLSLRLSPSPSSHSLSPLPPASTSNETIIFFISSSPSMRARHWKQVLRFAKGGSVHLLGRGGTFDPSVLEELTFGQLLDMGLHSESTSKI